MPTETAKHLQALQTGYQIHWYEILQILGQGGFGITYLANDTNLDQKVAIKEYLPKDLAMRMADASVRPMADDDTETFNWGLTRFLSEARTLAKFRHPNIVRVLSVFEQNNTAYMVMEYEEGRALSAVARAGELLDDAAVRGVLAPVMEGLELVHAAGFIHRDIKPDNIFVRASGSPVLLDFGSARQALGSETRTLTALVSPGFAPYEQYGSARDEDRQGPWTDIYGLGATIYRIVTGRNPIDAMTRVNVILDGKPDPIAPAIGELSKSNFGASLLAGIDLALGFNPKDRPQSIVDWRALLQRSDDDIDVPEPLTNPRLRSVDGKDATTDFSGDTGESTVRADTGPATRADTVEAATVMAFPARASRLSIWRNLAATVVLLVVGAVGAWWYFAAAEDPSVNRASTAANSLTKDPVPESVPEKSVKGTSVTGVASATVVQPSTGATAQTPAATSGASASQAQSQAALPPPSLAANVAASALAEDGTKSKQASADNPAPLVAEIVLPVPPRVAIAADSAISAVPVKPATQQELGAQVRNATTASQANEAPVAIGTQVTPQSDASPKPDPADQIQALLGLAATDISQLRLTSPPEANALARYTQVLALEPNNAAAIQGLKNIVTRYVELTDSSIAKKKFARAEQYLSRGRSVDAKHPALPDASERLAAARKVEKERRAREAAAQATAQATAQAATPTAAAEEATAPPTEPQSKADAQDEVRPPSAGADTLVPLDVTSSVGRDEEMRLALAGAALLGSNRSGKAIEIFLAENGEFRSEIRELQNAARGRWRVHKGKLCASGFISGRGAGKEVCWRVVELTDTTLRVATARGVQSWIVTR